MFLITLLCFFLVLGITVFIHELGHFLFAKKAGIYVYEFSLGMGPKLFQFHRKNDETVYSIRLFPIGGFVQMAGEEVETDEKIPVQKRMQSKTWFQRFSTMVAGVLFNFLLAIIILLIVAIIGGAPTLKATVGTVESGYPAEQAGLKENDQIVKINGKKVNNSDRFLLEFQVVVGDPLTLQVKGEDGKERQVVITPKTDTQDGTTSYRYGFGMSGEKEYGILPSIGYAFGKFGTLIEQMVCIIGYLFTGVLSLSTLSGPVGIFNVVGETAKSGILNLIYLIGFISINVGFINLLPIPAFDGGHVLFLIIEKIKGSPVNPKVENTIHTIFLVLLMALMVMITWNDIMRLFQ